MHPAFASPSPPSLRPIAPPLAPTRRQRASPPPSASAASPAEGDLATSDWRAFRAHLRVCARLNVAPAHHLSTSTAATSTSLISTSYSPSAPPPVWAHALPAPEVGALLVASPSHEWPEPFAHLRRALILLTAHSSAGTSGILLNRPTALRVGQHGPALARVGAEFADAPLMLGGDCSTGSLTVVHSFPPTLVPGATPIIPGVYVGGLNGARRVVREGKARPTDFRFFVAYAKWTADSLNAELERGAWRVASCSPALLLALDGTDTERAWREVDALL